MRPVGRIIVVGGHSRGVGKTALVEHLLRTLGAARLAAVKVSAHRHAAAMATPPVIEETFGPLPATQTGRYLAAGAERAWLCRCPSGSLPAAARFVRTLAADGWNVLVESNRIIEYLTPDLSLFVASTSNPDWKPSSGPSLRRADALVLSEGPSSVPEEARMLAGGIVERMPTFTFSKAWAVPGLATWVRRRMEDSCLPAGPSRPSGSPRGRVLPASRTAIIGTSRRRGRAA